MFIEKLDRSKECETVNVTLSYGEVRDISNSLFELSSYNKDMSDDLKQLRIDFMLLFDLIKNGRNDDFHVNKAVELYDSMDKKDD